MFEFDYSDELKAKKEFVLLAEGPGSFVIKKATTTDKEGAPLLSNKGDSMLALELEVTDCKGEVGKVWQNITSKMGWVLDGLGKSVGFHIYNKEGMLDENFLVGKGGKCEIEHFLIAANGKTKAQVKRYIPSVEDIKRYDPFDESNLF